MKYETEASHAGKPKVCDVRVHRFVLWLWGCVWRSHLRDGERPVFVKGWRTAIVKNQYGGRTTITPMPLRTWMNKREISKQRKQR